MSDDDGGGGGFMMAFASKLGAGAAKAGKRAAQSEAGRRATKAAIKGSMDAVRDDMISRYSEPNTPTSPTPAPAEEASEKKSNPGSKKVSAASSGMKENNVPSWMEDDNSDDDEPVSYSYREPTQSSHRKHTPPSHSNPPKPSFFDKFKSGSSSAKPRPRPTPKDPKERVFKHRLAKKPDWDKLPMAQALYHYKADMKCDLEFRKGQMIYVITRTDTQNDWWEGKIEGRVGIFPANYVKLLN